MPSALPIPAAFRSLGSVPRPRITSTPGTLWVQYDAASGQYTYVWKTNKAWANTCRQLVVQLNDNTSHVAYFNFKK